MKTIIIILSIVVIITIFIPCNVVKAVTPTLANFADISKIEDLPKGINYIPEDTIVWMKESETGYEDIEMTRVSGNSFNCRVINKSIDPSIVSNYPVRLYTLKDKLTDDELIMFDLPFKEQIKSGLLVEASNSFGELNRKSLDLNKDSTVNLNIKDTTKPYWLSFGNTITYSGATNTITVTNNTTQLFEDIYQADVLGGWGVVTKQGNNQYYLQAQILLGDATNPYTISDSNKEVVFWDGGAVYYIVTTANTVFTSGVLIDESLKTTGNGVSYHWEDTGGFGGYGVRTYSNSTAYLYSSSFSSAGATIYYQFHRLWGCLFNDDSLVILAHNDVDRLLVNDALFLPGAGASMTNILASSSTETIRFQNNAEGTLLNCVITTTDTELFYVYNVPNKTLNLIDCELNIWGMKLVAGGSGYDGSQILRQYTTNIKVIDQDGNPIENAEVALIDQYGTETFSTTTNATGQIAEQTVTYKLYEPTSAPSAHVVETTYSPHTLTVTDGTNTYESIFDIDYPIDYIITLEEETEISMIYLGFGIVLGIVLAILMICRRKRGGD